MVPEKLFLYSTLFQSNKGRKSELEMYLNINNYIKSTELLDFKTSEEVAHI